ncbi:MAG: polysaccharide deacetylase family protein [Verrucomicrobiales bacterium]|nr:polysaccharide deacetylase family protein [Verrucomicrobiales bacterium]
MRALLLCLIACGVFCGSAGRAQSLAERLGYGPGDRLLIINGDDTGMCHTANLATTEAMEKGLLTGATIMVPCPWFPEIVDYAKAHPEKDFGIHVVQTSEWIRYRWGPVAPRDQVPGLLDPDGYFWHETPQVYAKGTPAEALIEARAQVRKALAAGIDVTHLDSHMGVMQYLPAYLEAYLQLAVEFDLPVRMASQADMAAGGQPGMRARFAAKGILFPDDFIYDVKYEGPEGVKAQWLKRLSELKPGVTEIFIHAGKPTEELKAITGSWAVRSAEFETFTTDPEIRALLERQGIRRIGYRAIRDLQRKLRSAGGK